MRERYLPLHGRDLERYSSTVSRLILGAKLNRWFTDPFGASNLIGMLGDPSRAELHEEIHIDRASGLPWLKDILSVQVDRGLADEFLTLNAGRRGSGRLTPRLRARLEYYERLLRYHFPPLTRMEARLLKVLPERSVGIFEAVFDRFDPGEGVFVRHSLKLEQTDRVWKDESLIERRGAQTVQTPEFREMLSRFTRDESELTVLLTGNRSGIRVLEASRGRIGPLWSPFTPAPAGWRSEDPGAFVLHIPFDAASVDFKEDSDTDPFTAFFKDCLSPNSRPLLEEAAQGLGYRVRKERTFVCTPEARDALSKKLEECGEKCRILTV